MRLRLGPMKITFCCTDTKAEPWLQGLAAALPGAEISVWQPGAPQADYAVVWAPPQQFMDEQPGRWGSRKPRRRSDYPIGVMGLGVLGERVAKALAQFEFPINGWSRSPKAIDGVRGFAGTNQFNDLLAASRVLVNLLPLTPDTTNVINKGTLARLQPGAYVINVARGAHLVDEDLVAAIDSGHVAGATLDVFRTEPLPAGHAFWTHPRITITPHTSARTLRDESIAQIARKMVALERGEAVAGIVNPVRGY